MEILFEGYIAALPEDKKELEIMGITLGEYDLKDGEFKNCIVPKNSLDKLDKHFGRYYWALFPTTIQ